MVHLATLSTLQNTSVSVIIYSKLTTPINQVWLSAAIFAACIHWPFCFLQTFFRLLTFHLSNFPLGLFLLIDFLPTLTIRPTIIDIIPYLIFSSLFAEAYVFLVRVQHNRPYALLYPTLQSQRVMITRGISLAAENFAAAIVACHIQHIVRWARSHFFASRIATGNACLTKVVAQILQCKIQIAAPATASEPDTIETCREGTNFTTLTSLIVKKQRLDGDRSQPSSFTTSKI